MNPFKSFTLTWWQGSFLKIALICVGVVIGANWPEIFASWTNVLLTIFFVFSGYITFIWWRQ